MRSTPGVVEDLPGLVLVGNRPEAQEASVFPGAGHETLQFGPLPGRHGVASTPLEVARPFIADQWNEMGRGLAAEIAGSTVEGAVAGGVGLHEAPWSPAAQDCGDGTGALPALEVGGEKGLVAGEELVEDRIGLVPIRLDVDEEDEALLPGIDTPLVGTDTLRQGFEVEFLKGAVLADSQAGVSDMEFVAPKKDVGLHAAESLLKRVEKRAFVAVVVVGVGAEQGGGAPVRGERLALFSAGRERDQGNQEEEPNKGVSHAMDGEWSARCCGDKTRSCLRLP